MANMDERLAQMTPLQRAVFALKETQTRLETLEKQRSEPIAIVGLACRFPGRASDPAAYWRLLCDGVDAIGEIPPDRWDVDAFYDPDPTVPGKMNTRWGGFLDGIDRFDNHFFGISDREAEQIDPQHRLVLELAWEALEDAGMPPSSLRGSRTGVFLGLSHSEYGIMLSTDLTKTDAFVSTGTAHCLAANRLSFAFDLYGPSLVLDTACSSSLVAVHLACQSLRSGESEMALAGGVNVILSPLATVNLTKAGFSAPDGRVRAFDAAASGYVRSEGAGLVVLKPLAAALQDRDPVYAVIRGSAVTQNGWSNGLTAPSRRAQERTLREAYRQAKVSPGQIQYVETQGTGTPLGDAIEAMTLGQVLSEGRAPGSCCAIGSVKTNIGHLEAASGVASLLKVSLALKHRLLPPSLHFQTPNPEIPFARLPLRVQQTLAPWPASDAPRRAGVSAFGFGGSNAHVVLEEPPPDAPPQTAASSATSLRLLPLSARTEPALRELTARYVALLRDESLSWPDICHTASVHRDHHDCRLAVLATGPQQAHRLLQSALHDQPQAGWVLGRKPYGRDVKVALVYDGRQEVWRTCGSSLAALLPRLGEAVQQVDAALRSVAGWTLSSVVSDGSLWDDPARASLAAMAGQLALTAWWRRAGVVPNLVLGRGCGELTAACVAGILTLEEAFRAALACRRKDAGQGLGSLNCRTATLPFFSACDGQAHPGPDLEPVHWQRCLVGEEGLATAMQGLGERGVDICLEIGPDSLTDRLVEHGLPAARLAEPPQSVATRGPGGVSADGLVASLAALYAAGVDVAWTRTGATDGRYVRIPTYPWQRRRLWAQRKHWLAGLPPAVGVRDPLGVDAGRPLESPGDRAADSTQVDRGPPGDGPIPPRPLPTRPDMNTPYVPPRTALEQTLARSWREILHLDRVGIHDNFFELGGDSLQATILLNALREQLHQDVQPHLLFQVQTISELAALLRHSCPAVVRRLFPAEPLDGRDITPATSQVASAAAAPPAEADAPPTPTPTPAESGRTAETGAIPRLRRAGEFEDLLSRVDELSDDEVDLLLKETRSESEDAHG